LPAYIIANVIVTDWDRYRDYVRHAPRVVRQFGGRFLSRGSTPFMLEGDAENRRVVLLEFPSMEIARAFFASEAYAEIKRLRDGAATAQFFAIDGYPVEEWERAAAEAEHLPRPI
jgi:uncharacterized protein (DUF1330 family)